MRLAQRALFLIVAIAGLMPLNAMADKLEIKRWNPASMSKPKSYSQIVTVKGDHKLILLGGKAGLYADGTVPDSLEEQVKQTFQNITLALKDAGAGPKDVVELQVFVVDLANINPEPIYQAIRDYFPENAQPVSMVIGVAALARPTLKLEINVTAAIAE